MSRFKQIIFDFDGVLLDTNLIRAEGFRELFNFDNPKVCDDFMDYIYANKGLSRYDKIRYYYSRFKGREADLQTVNEAAKQYSDIMIAKVLKADEINGARDFLQKYYKTYHLALVSASDQNELREICRQRAFDNFFQEILGSPLAKADNIIQLLKNKKWNSNDTIYVGDACNDFDAALSAKITFIGFGRNNFPQCHPPLLVDDYRELEQFLNQ